MKKPSERLLVKVVSWTIYVFLAIGIIAIVVETALSLTSVFSLGPAGIVTLIVENSLLLIALLEIYMGAQDFVKGKGRSVFYVLDATLSIVTREVIIYVFVATIDPVTLLALGGLVALLASSRFILSRSVRPKRKYPRRYRREET